MEQMEEKKQIVLELMQDKHYIPMKFKELAVILNVKKEDRKLLNDILSQLIAERKISLSKRGKYSITKEQYVQGIFIGNERGFGFVETNEDEEDYFIPESEINGAFHHDTVLVAINPVQTGKRKEGRIVKILSHEIRQVVGYFQKNKTFGYVIADNQKIAADIYIAGKNTMGAVQGHKVVAEIIQYGTKDKKPEGKIVEILGHANDPGVDILSIVKSYGIPTEFPREVMMQTAKVSQEVSPEEKKGRMDIRHWQTVTIDGEDAKDLDDAITLTKEDEIYTLGVHIADVSHYVVENSPLDEEAKTRGTSVYLVDRVIPMIPHKLSNGICSLNQGEDRLTLSCIMKFNEKGEMLDYQVAETVIRVDRRMSYTEVKEILENPDSEIAKQCEKFIPMFQRMKVLSKILRERRNQRGAIDFELPECKIKLDENGHIQSILPYERNVATNIIEDFMLAANETIAEYYYWQQIPFVYRNHDEPDGEKMKQLSEFITNFGYSVKVANEQIHPKELQKLLQKVEGSPQEAMINRVILRSMKRAEYTPECRGHFGLASKYYCHFTSPIRRYPDLQIHRIIKECLHGTMTEKHKEHYQSILLQVTKNCSLTERRADDAERETEKMKKAEYMRGFIGEAFDGVVSGITGFGIYVELPNTVEGLVHVSTMNDDHYIYDETTYSMTGERTQKTYKLGQRVKIRVEAADKISRTIDFSFVGK